MIDEMQDTIDKQKDKIEEQQQAIDEMQEQGIKNAIAILQGVGMTDLEIIMHICKQYQVKDEQVRRYL